MEIIDVVTPNLCSDFSCAKGLGNIYKEIQ